MHTYRCVLFYPNPLAKKSYHPRSRPRSAHLTPQYMQRVSCVMGRETLASISSSTSYDIRECRLLLSFLRDDFLIRSRLGF